MNPKFSVGEIVILQSKHYPALNGEYTVTQVIHEPNFDWDGNLVDYGYNLAGSTISWAEHALRKRHQKGDMSFKELMSDLKTNIQERIS